MHNYIDDNYPKIETLSNSDIVLEELYLSSKGLCGFHIIDATFDMMDKLCIYNENELEKLLINKKIKRR